MPSNSPGSQVALGTNTNSTLGSNANSTVAGMHTMFNTNIFVV